MASHQRPATGPLAFAARAATSIESNMSMFSLPPATRIAIESPQPARLALRASRPRRGISLLEVLISMFVLLFGLMGVAALFPAGNHYAGRGDQFERGAALADAAFAQLKSRGLLRPDRWMYADLPTTGLPMMQGDYRLIQSMLPAPWARPNPFNEGGFNLTGPDGVGHAFVIDPMGAAAGRASQGAANYNQRDAGWDVFPFARFDANYPDGTPDGADDMTSNADNPWAQRRGGVLYGNRWPIRRMTIPADQWRVPSMSQRAADQVVALPDDVAIDLPQQADRPGVQRWSAVDLNASPTPENAADDTPLSRSFKGDYTWLATIVPTTQLGWDALRPSHPMYGSELYEVSVAVFYKRVPLPGAATERSVNATLNATGDLTLYVEGGNFYENAEALDAAVDGLRSGQWIALAGVHPVSGRFLLKWYRLLSFDDESQENQGGMVGFPRIQGLANQTAVRGAMIDGPEWPVNPSNINPASNNYGYPIQQLRAILLPGVIGVSTQYLPMEPTGR